MTGRSHGVFASLLLAILSVEQLDYVLSNTGMA